jgi:hypothetical protein
MRIGNRGPDLDAGELFTLHASAAATAIATTNDTAVYLGGERAYCMIILAVTAAATDADDILDVYIDFSFDNVTFYNAVRFSSVLGNGGAKNFAATLGPTFGGGNTVDISSDVAVTVVRAFPLCGYLRSRYVVTEGAGGGAAGFTFSVKGYAV